MDKEDKLLAKCLIFAGSFIFTILSFITLVQTAIDFNHAKDLEPALLKGANLTPLLVVFFLVTLVSIAIVIASFICTFIKSDKAKTWQNRLVICNIIMLVLTVALYAIMKFSSYVDFEAIHNAVHNNTTEGIIRKFYTLQFTTSLMLTAISLVINLFMTQLQGKLDTNIVDATPVAQEVETISSEQDQLEQEIAQLKEQIHIKALKEKIAELHNQLGTQSQTTAEPVQEKIVTPAKTTPVESESINVEDNQINIEQALINEPIIDRVLNSNESHNDIVEEDAEIKEFEEILGLNDDN